MKRDYMTTQYKSDVDMLMDTVVVTIEIDDAFITLHNTDDGG